MEVSQKREKESLLGEGEKKILPVVFEEQQEVKVNYAIAKFRDKGIAFKTETRKEDVIPKARCWIKKGNTIGNKEFHLTLRFQGVDYKTKQGQDMFDIDLYLPLDEFNEKYNMLEIDETYNNRFKDKNETTK